MVNEGLLWHRTNTVNVPIGRCEVNPFLAAMLYEANAFDEVYVDTDSEEIAEIALKTRFQVIARKLELAKNTANGNDLLVAHYLMFSQYDYYFQLFATAPFLLPKTICKCYEMLTDSAKYDSLFTIYEHKGFFWLNSQPVNYRPGILPRSQDLNTLVEETTGFYGITRASL